MKNGNIAIVTCDRRFAIMHPGDGRLLFWRWLDFRPAGLAVADSGTIFVIDEITNRIVLMREDGTEITDLPLKGNQFVVSGGAQGVALTAQGNILVARVDTGFVHVLARLGTPIKVIGDPDKRSPGHLLRPCSVDVNEDGDVAVGEATGTGGFGSRLRSHLFGADGKFIRTLRTVPSGQDAATSVHFDTEGNVVSLWSPRHPLAGDEVTVLRRDGSVLWRCMGSGSEPGQFCRPRSLTAAPDGRIVVADTGNSRIQLL